MIQFKGTSGKWQVSSSSDYSGEYSLRNEKYAPTFEEDLYNAQLISKSPDMLAMLQYFIQHNMLSVTGEVMAEQLIKEATTL